MGWSNGSADALVLGMLSGCAVPCTGQSLCAGAAGSEEVWCCCTIAGVLCGPRVGAGHGVWSMQGLDHPAQELCDPETCCLPTKVGL